MTLPVEVSDKTRQSRSNVFSEVNFFQYFFSVKGAYLSPAIYIPVKWFIEEKNVRVKFHCEEKENNTRIRSFNLQSRDCWFFFLWKMYIETICGPLMNTTYYYCNHGITCHQCSLFSGEDGQTLTNDDLKSHWSRQPKNKAGHLRSSRGGEDLHR